MPGKKDVVIVGAGVIGCSIAYHLAKLGVTSQIIERESIGARASGKAWALIPFPAWQPLAEKIPGSLYAMPEDESCTKWIDLLWMAYHRLGDIALDIKEKGGIDIEYAECVGTIVAFDEETEQLARQLNAAIRADDYLQGDWHTAEELKAIFPDINPAVRGGSSLPLLQINAYKYTLGLAQAAESMGAEVKQGEVVGFNTKSGKITSVKLASGAEIEADAFVIAMGPWTGQGTKMLGKELPILINMEECLVLEVPKKLPLHVVTDGINTVVPKKNGEVIVGQIAQFHLQDDFNVRLSDQIKAETMEGCIQVLTGLEDAKIVDQRGDVEGWAPPPARSKPVMGRLPEWENGYVAARVGTLGMTYSSGTGKVMADLIANGGVAPYRLKNMLEHLSPARG